MGQTITSRLPDEMIKELEKIAKIEKLDKSSVVRRLLDKAINIWKEEYALKLFQDRKLSLGKAVEMSSLSIWEFLEKLSQEKIPLHYDPEELQKDLEIIEKYQNSI